MCGFTLVLSLLHAVWSAGKLWDTACLLHDHSFWGMQVMQILRLFLDPPLSLIFLHVLSVSRFPFQLLVPSYNAISSKAAMQSRKKCHNELIDQIFLNLFIYCIQYLL